MTAERIYCPPDLREALRNLAKRENRSMIDELRDLIKKREAELDKKAST